jgi:hypothetical protein
MILFALLIVYIGFSLFLFFQWVAPSLDGRTNQHIAADSVTYLYFADSLRSGNVAPYVIEPLSSFPNNLWSPVLLALVLKSRFAMVVANYAMFFLALVLLKKSFYFSAGVFVSLLLLNATTTISLLSVNKEIVDILAVSLFFFARRRHRNGVLLLALLLALFNRFEVCVVMLIFLFAESKLNPWRRRRVVTLVVVIIILSAMLPLLASENLNGRLEEARGANSFAWFNTLEMHYLYGVAVIPKIAYTLFGALVAHPFKSETYYNFSDLANSTILYSNNLATAVVFVVLAWKRRFTVRSDIVYFAMMGCGIMVISMVTQVRYVYFAYMLFCLQAAQTRARGPACGIFPHPQGSGD